MTPAVVRMEASPRIALTNFIIELPLGSRMQISQKISPLRYCNNATALVQTADTHR